MVGYRTRADLTAALRLHPGRVLRVVPALKVAEVLPRARPQSFAAAAGDLPGIDYVQPPVARFSDGEPAIQPDPDALGGVLEWQYPAARVDGVPDAVLRAASGITIAVIDTGADLSAPDIAAKSPVAYSVVGGGQSVPDTVGHGTFVAALAAGSGTNGDGMTGFGGDARLMVVQASRTQGEFSDVDEAAAIVWAVDHGARIVNLSLGGPDTSATERSAIDYAVRHGALIVAAVGNADGPSDPVEYPAALLQPVGSDGQGGVGLSVGASDRSGGRAPFSTTGSQLSLVAPGTAVLSALSSAAPNTHYRQVTIPGTTSGLYGLGSGTSFAAPEVAGVAALVWAARPGLTAQQVATVLKETASNHGAWNPETGYGVIDAAAAVGLAAEVVPAATPAPAKPVVPGSSLTLNASRTRGRAPLRIILRARLRAADATAPVRNRQLTIEAYTGSGWESGEAVATGAAGRASWRFTLTPGVYRVRARFGGADDLRGTVSRVVSVRVS